MRMLQGDRRANVELLETHKKMNSVEVQNLRDENKELRMRFAQLKMKDSAGEMGTEAQVDSMKKQLVQRRKEYDGYKRMSTNLTAKLETLKDEVRACELESRRPTEEDTPLTRSIRVLENRLDKAMIKYNEAMSIRKTYEQIVHRLKEERVGFDNQLSALERTLAAKQRDYEELLLLSGDANHAREISQMELDRVRGGYEEERVRRDNELRERHQLFQMRKQMSERAEKRRKERERIAEKEMEGLDEEGEKEFKLKAKMIDEKAMKNAEAKSRIDIFENAFRKIKEATGVSDVNEVIQKIISQEGTTENLLALTKENQQRMESLNEESGSLKSKLDNLKFSGLPGGHRRKLVDDQEDQLVTSNARLQRGSNKHERLNNSLVSIKAGIQHMLNKLLSVNDDFPQLVSHHVSNDSVLETMNNIMHSTEAMMNRVKANSIETGVLAAAADSGTRGGDVSASMESLPSLGSISYDSTSTGMDSLAEEKKLMEARPYNQRVYLPNGEEIYNPSTDLDGDAADEEELTRDKVKLASSQIVSAISSAKKKKKKKKETW